MSTAIVTTRRPTLRWVRGSRADAVRVEVCSDRACAHVIDTRDSTGESVTPASDLPPGVAYWRVTGLASGAIVSGESRPVWQFHVPPRSAAVDAVVGWVTDVNGDGFADVPVVTPREGTAVRVNVFLGGRGGPSCAPGSSVDLTGHAWGGGMGSGRAISGYQVVAAGDLDGDGFGDLVVARKGDVIGGLACFGGASGLRGAALDLSLPDRYGTGASAASGGGDVDGDGWGDLVLGADELSDDTHVGGSAYVYRGGASGVASGRSPFFLECGRCAWPAQRLFPPSSRLFGRDVLGAGDVDADGFADVIVPAGGTGTPERAFLYRGGAGGLGEATVLSSPDAEATGFATRGARAGDVDGDGYADVVLSASIHPAGASGAIRPGRAYLFRGRAGGLPAAADQVLDAPRSSPRRFGVGVAGAGDVDRDGYADVVIGSANVDNTGPWHPYLFRGGPAGLIAPPAAELSVESDEFAGVGDVDGDGLDDVVARVGSVAFVFRGAVGGALAPSPSYVLGRGSAMVCDGACVDLQTNRDHCGRCDNHCPEGLGCAGGACLCAAMCDGACVDVQTRRDHCGRCGSRCATGDQCVAGACVCATMCGGACADLQTSPDHCGRCGSRCPAGHPCVAGACVTPLTAPAFRQLAPLSTATTSSQRPTLRWTLPAPATGAHVDICHDRACGRVEYAADVDGAQMRPMATLSPGVHYWRLFRRDGGVTSSVATATWQFQVRRRDGAMDTSSGTAPDFNGDGFAEITTSDNAADAGAGRICVYAGGAAGPSPLPVRTLRGADGSNTFFGQFHGSAGDVNGDGYADLVAASSTVGRIYAFHGGPAGLSSTPDATVLTGDPAGVWLRSLAGLGDLDGDGYGDVVAQSTGDGAVRGPGRVLVYRGGPGGLLPTPVAVALPSGRTWDRPPQITRALAPGDVDGDGRPDLMVFVSDGATRPLLYRGAPEGLVFARELLHGEPAGRPPSPQVTGSGDVNGDGLRDVVLDYTDFRYVVPSRPTWQAQAWHGRPEGLRELSDATAEGPVLPAASSYGIGSAVLGDVNGDGFSDIGLIATIGSNRWWCTYLGTPDGLPPTPSTTWTLSASDPSVGLSAAGDVNGDGYDDVVLRTDAGAEPPTLRFHPGSAGGLAATPVVSLSPPR